MIIFGPFTRLVAGLSFRPRDLYSRTSTPLVPALLYIVHAPMRTALPPCVHSAFAPASSGAPAQSGPRQRRFDPCYGECHTAGAVAMLAVAISLLGLGRLLLGRRLVQLLLDRLPEDGENHGLADVRQQARLQPATEEAGEAVLGDDALDGGDVAEVGVGGGLLQRLDHAQRVGHGVGHGGGADADGGVARQLHLALLLGNLRLQEVEGDEPGVVADPVGGEVGGGAAVEHADAALGHLLLQQGEGGIALHLEGGLEGVDGGEEDTKRGATGGGECGHHGNGHVGLEGLEGSEHASVGSSVAEARQGVLNDGEPNTLVQTGDAALLDKGLEGLAEGAAVGVLVVHQGAHPHECADLDDARSHTGNATAERLGRGLLHDIAEGKLMLRGRSTELADGLVALVHHDRGAPAEVGVEGSRHTGHGRGATLLAHRHLITLETLESDEFRHVEFSV
mmetsp:Transcript_2942/g.6112  ORF Transcript_2942/g.6112 Transcript_2942/m.6112 type:complete len:451 (+) Transcript_2942:88-1440(+)